MKASTKAKFITSLIFGGIIFVYLVFSKIFFTLNSLSYLNIIFLGAFLIGIEWGLIIFIAISVYNFLIRKMK